MATPNQALLDDAVRHQVDLTRYGTAVAARATRLLNSLDDELIGAAEGAARTGANVTASLATIKRVSSAAVKLVGDYLGGELEGLASSESTYQGDALTASLPADADPRRDPTAAALRAVVYAQPFQGGLLREWVAGLDDGRFKRLRQAVRISLAAGEGQDALVRRIRGTARSGYTDGILQVSRRSAVAIARTAIAHVSSAAREAYLLANADLVVGVRWVSTLDAKTSTTCAGLDGRVFALGKGLRPPAHIGCRSTTCAVLLGSPEAAKLTYQAWLAGRPAAEQDEILGVTRAKLFRQGGLTLDRFVDKSGAVLTLADLRRRDAAAFTRADIP